MGLPTDGTPPTNSYYTTTEPGKLLLISSLASSMTSIIVSPFMLLYSFIVAQAATHTRDFTAENTSSLFFRVLSGSWGGAFRWVQLAIFNKSRTNQSPPNSRATNIAALGCILTIMVR